MADEAESTGMETTEGMTDGAPEVAQQTDAVAASAAPPAAAAPPQQQGPDWNTLGVPFDQARERLNYYQQLSQRYESDPAWAQKFDQLYNGQQQQQAHPYDWMMDEKRLEALRSQGEQHPEFARYQGEFTNFFHNPIGQLASYANHPKVVEAVYSAMLPQLQDLMSRQMQPLQQYISKQGEQQFRAQYEKAWVSLPDHIKQAASQNRFGDWNNNRQQAIINAIEFAKSMPKANPMTDGAQPPAKPTDKPNQPAPQKTAPSASSQRRSKAAEEFDREYAAALSGKK